MESSARQDSTVAIIAALSKTGDQVEAVRRALGLSGNVPGEIAKRLEMMTMGSVTPKIELTVAVRLAEKFPIEFMLITNEITQLTGAGR